MNIFDSRNQKRVVKFQQAFTIFNNFGNSAKVAGLGPATGRPESCNLIKKRLWHRCFPVNFENFF